MLESISQNLNIPKLYEECINGSEYGRIKVNFIKKYGSLSSYNIPWKQLDIEKIELNNVIKEFKYLNNFIYILIDLPNAPIFRCPNNILNDLLYADMMPYDVDIYVFDDKFEICIIYTGLFDKNIYIHR